jgi:periplasmic protein TonB
MGVLPLDHAAIEPRALLSSGVPSIRSRRLLIVAAASVATHFVLLVTLGLYFKFWRPAILDRPAIQVTLIDLPLRGLTGGGGGQSGAIVSRPAPPITQLKIAPKRKPQLPPHRVESETIEEHRLAPIPEPKIANKQNNSEVNPLKEAGPSAASAASTTKGQRTTTGDEGAGSGVGRGMGGGIVMGSGSGAGGGFGNGENGPRAIYAPVPSIPEDLRDQVMHAKAVARFKVSREGKVTVALLQHTDFSELDEIILDTLREWRFSPAMDNGVAVDSEADVRLLITVK